MSLPYSHANPRRRYGAQTRHPFDGLGWLGRLSEAQEESEVLGVVKDHFAQFSPLELAHLPKHLLPPRLVDADDVSSYAFLLARQQRLGESSQVLDKLAGFVTNAAHRLSKVLFRPRNSRAADAKPS